MKVTDRFKIARNAYSYRLLKRKGMDPSITNVTIPQRTQLFLGNNLPIKEICLGSQQVVVQRMNDEFNVNVECLSDKLIEQLCEILENDVLESAELG